MKTLKIKWQRLTEKGGKTCKRCGETEKEIKKAYEILEKELGMRGIKVVLEKEKLSLSSFKNNPSESNRIWINNKSLEEWINARVGKTPCCDVCGDAPCRTVKVNRHVYESIPAKLIVKAGRLAAKEGK